MADLIKILVIDDEEDTFLTARRLLRSQFAMQYEVHWESDEERAVVMMAENAFDLYLVDYRLVKTTGIELFLSARNLGCRGPVIMLTGIGDPAIDLAAMEAGADDYLNKDHLQDGMLERAIRYAIERRRTEKAITDRQLALSETLKMATLGKMTSSIAHEINNPIAIIIGMTSRLEKMAHAEQLSSATALPVLAMIKDATTRISRIIRSLYGHARNTKNDPYEVISAKRIVDDASELCHPQLSCNYVELRMGQVPLDLSLECRPIEISHVLVNLICNAVDAVKDLKERWVAIDVQENGDRVKFAVADSGKGIPQNLSGQILKPFFSTKSHGKGMGLGLSIGRSIVEQHSGTLVIDQSCPNTRFVVELPKAKTDAVSFHPMTVLIVDDSEEIVTMIAAELSRYGHRTIEAYSGSEGLKWLQDEKVDVVISDLLMPGLDGAAFYRKAAAEKILPKKFIFITGHPNLRVLDEFLNESVEVFGKPFNFTELQESVNAVSLTMGAPLELPKHA